MRAMTAALVTMVAMTGAAAAQPLCDEHKNVVEALSKGYAERLSAVGMAGGTGVLEVFASPGGTWSIVVTDANGQSCIMAVGTGWETLPPQTAAREPTKDKGI